MKVAIVHCRACRGIQAPAIRVEVHLSGGLPSTQIVGLPAAAVRESRDRVRAALLSTKFKFPTRRITINLAPADIPKEGSRFDLPIAIGILAASEQIPTTALDHIEFLGELGLTGELCAIDGVLPAVVAAWQQGKRCVVPAANASEAALAHTGTAYVAKSLVEVCTALRGEEPWQEARLEEQRQIYTYDRQDINAVCGQVHAKRALEITAAGGHHLLLIGPPGCGKTLLASCLPNMLPEMTEEEALETAAIVSISSAGRMELSRWRDRPFRSPHHSASAVALIGGGRRPRPGEISLAHHGVLFLDELTEWKRQTLEMLREPLESGIIRIAREQEHLSFPARFQLVAAMNPCPCGWAGDPSGRCHCTPGCIERYLHRLSGPLLERIDLQVNVPRIAAHHLLNPGLTKEHNSATLRHRILQARKIQLNRNNCLNAYLKPDVLNAHCAIQREQRRFLESVIDQRQLSGRTAHRIIRVARTIADLDQQDHIKNQHLNEAIGFRLIEQRLSST